MYFLPFPVLVICVGRGFEKALEFVEEFFKRWWLLSVHHECEEGSFCSAFCKIGIPIHDVWCIGFGHMVSR